MPQLVQCASCETSLLGLESFEPAPIGKEECPKCGATDFVGHDGA